MGEGSPENGHALANLPGLSHYDIAGVTCSRTTTLAFLDRES